jgi:hypothetical protein
MEDLARHVSSTRNEDDASWLESAVLPLRRVNIDWSIVVTSSHRTAWADSGGLGGPGEPGTLSEDDFLCQLASIRLPRITV